MQYHFVNNNLQRTSCVMYFNGGCQDKAFVITGKLLLWKLFVLQGTAVYYCFCFHFPGNLTYSSLENQFLNLVNFSVRFENKKNIFFLHWAKLFMLTFLNAYPKETYSSWRIIWSPDVRCLLIIIVSALVIIGPQNGTAWSTMLKP